MNNREKGLFVYKLASASRTPTPYTIPQDQKTQTGIEGAAWGARAFGGALAQPHTWLTNTFGKSNPLRKGTHIDNIKKTLGRNVERFIGPKLMQTGWLAKNIAKKAGPIASAGFAVNELHNLHSNGGQNFDSLLAAQRERWNQAPPFGKAMEIISNPITATHNVVNKMGDHLGDADSYGGSPPVY